jgi:hypothetical protein
MSRPTHTARRARGRGLAAAIAVSLGLAGACTTARNSLGTTAGPCFRSQATASAAVHNRGQLVGVRRIQAPRLAGRLPTATSLPPREVCVFAFKGTWQAKDVDKPSGLPAGRYALVFVGARHGALVATFLDDKLPTRFRHL